MAQAHGDGALVFHGTLQLADVQRIGLPADGAPRDTVLDLCEADIADGRVMAALTARVRQLLAAGVNVTLLGPPQLVVHNLYRIGRYPHPQLTVREMRQDEAYG